MKERIEGMLASAGAGLSRFGRWIRRHPVKTAALAPLAVVIYVAALYPFTPSIGDIRKSKDESPTVVLSADGKELATFKRANRDWVKLDEISPKVKEALIATEDKRFYDHNGIDFVRTAKAVVNTLQGEVEGGSTLTQQLARNLYPEEIGREQTVTRKVKEAITALKIEAIYSKDEILETYLNSVSFLYNAWGIEMASRTYFNKSAKQLDELEAATLIGMLKGTSYYNPVINPERAVQRRNTVLAMMVKEGKLPEDRYEQLKAQPMKLDFERVPEFNGTAPHLAEHLRRWLLDWADKHDYNVYADGLVVRTTIDSRLQAAANEAVERQGKALQAVADVEWSRSGMPALGSDTAAYVSARGKAAPFEHFWNTHSDVVKAWMRDSKEYREARDAGKDDAAALQELRGNPQYMADLRRQKTMLQVGFVAIEPSTGMVKAWVGSRDYADDKFDHVQQARRQPGSTFKPFVYGAAFEMGHHPTETLMDQPVAIQIDRNQVWRPGDVESSPSNQPMTLRDGLAKSKNTITAQLMMQVGPSRVASLARSMGVRQSKLNEVPSLALGTSPVTLKEMVTSFATIANSGRYIEPRIVTAIEDREGNVLDQLAAPPSEQAMSTEAAQTLLDVLRGSIEYGTAVGLRPRFGLDGDLAGKTGTTQDNTDGWFILMHPQLVAGAWVGFNDNRVTMRSSYWGQGAHNALLVVGDAVKGAQKAGVIDAKAKFSAPRLRDTEKPLMDRMGDWWNSVFSAPGAGDPSVAAVPPVQLPEVNMQPPVLEPPPVAIAPQSPPMPATPPMPMALPDAPVVVEAQRVPSFPRPLESTRSGEGSSSRTYTYESARPIETVPGTQVYRTPEPALRSAPVASSTPSTPSTTRELGAGSSSGSSSYSASSSTASGSSSSASGTVTLSREGSSTVTLPASGNAGSSSVGGSASTSAAMSSSSPMPAAASETGSSPVGQASGSTTSVAE